MLITDSYLYFLVYPERERGGGVRMWVRKKSYRFNLWLWPVLFSVPFLVFIQQWVVGRDHDISYWWDARDSFAVRDVSRSVVSPPRVIVGRLVWFSQIFYTVPRRLLGEGMCVFLLLVKTQWSFGWLTKIRPLWCDSLALGWALLSRPGACSPKMFIPDKQNTQPPSPPSPLWNAKHPAFRKYPSPPREASAWPRRHQTADSDYPLSLANRVKG